jgi:hypothetical protein
MLNKFIIKFRNSSKSLIYIIEKSAVRFIAGALVCGSSALAVAPAPADLDQTFGTNGVSVKAIGDASYFQDVALQPDGKIGASEATGRAQISSFSLPALIKTERSTLLSVAETATLRSIRAASTIK